MVMENEAVFSRVLRAGRRTYFFDVRETKAGDHYLTITESKKFTNEDGSFQFKKHKVYLYKEDMAEFKSMLSETLHFIESSEEPPKSSSTEDRQSSEQDHTSPYTDLSFDDI